ncbi:glycoside hydrolase family 113 [Clostridium niameyense]|uniref:glycoside hydrolase family 113 n=1 Tax=Clostridium niameyense TaxID=1622073 RepID=UPI00067EE630|nr:hypothetical protein [Clostridium niameyense]
MKKFKIISLIIILVIIGFNLSIPTIRHHMNRIETPWGEKIKSGNLSTDYDVDKALEDVDKLRLNTLNVPIIVNIQSLSSNDMTIDEISKNKAIKLIKILNRKGINVILEPFPWIKNGELYETQWNPENIDKFFYNWENKVIKKLLKEVAIPYNVYAFNVASNLINMESKENRWCNIIDNVRKVYKYKGLITYRTNWWYTSKEDALSYENFNKKLNNKLFSKLDFISVAAYFELSDKKTNNMEYIKECIYSSKVYNRNQNIYGELKQLSKKWNKPIFFGELGFPRREGAAISPWNPEPTNVQSEKEQAVCFEAYNKVFKKEKWNLGFSVFAIGNDDKDKNYYPGKSSSTIIKNWYEE